jgi:hypothetical protein
VAELGGDVPELNPGGEELGGVGMAQILESPVPDFRPLQNPPPLAFSEVRRIDPLEDERIWRALETGMVELRQRVTEPPGQGDRPGPPALRRSKPASAGVRLID